MNGSTVRGTAPSMDGVIPRMGQNTNALRHLCRPIYKFSLAPVSDALLACVPVL